MTEAPAVETDTGRDFIRDIIAADLAAKRHTSVVTRFPPEPNGYLHIGHAKSICLNFGVAQEFGGRCHLRFDDTNPTKEQQEYSDAIERDVRWLGFDWGSHLYHASDYFDQLYAWAEHLICTGKAYVDDQSQEEMRARRGTLTEPGQHSPWRERRVEENLDLFRRMRAGEFPNGARVLRAKIDMASGNINLRDPVLYRILHASHPRTGTAWCIYPSYDFAHGQSDAIEHVTHSLCTLEFEDHRPLYDWLLEYLPVPSRPRQYEFARLLRLPPELCVERRHLGETPPKKFYRLSPGREVRLRYPYFITCREVVKAPAGEVIELRCTYDPQTRGGNAPDGRKVQATLHWVSAADAITAEIRLYNQLFARADPDVGNFAADLNPDSIELLTDCKLEPALATTNSAEPVQFERQGYFCPDPDSMPNHTVFYRTVGLRDTWAKVSAGPAAQRAA